MWRFGTCYHTFVFRSNLDYCKTAESAVMQIYANFSPVSLEVAAKCLAGDGGCPEDLLAVIKSFGGVQDC